MADYRLYYMRDARIVGREEFQANSDEAAVVYATELRGGHAAELWQGLHKLWSFEAHPTPPEDER